MKNTTFYQQGDVLIFKIDSSSVDFRNNKAFKKARIIDGKYILAYGEATGHSHVIEGIEEKKELLGNKVVVYNHAGTLYIKAKCSFTVAHQEHKPITIPKGTYKVGRVKEYDHFTQRARQVRD